MSYEFSEIVFDTQGNAPPNQMWADVRIIMATDAETHHGVRVPVLVPLDPAMTLEEIRGHALGEMRNLLEATLKLIRENDLSGLFAIQDTRRAEEAARLERMTKPEYWDETLNPIEAGAE